MKLHITNEVIGRVEILQFNRCSSPTSWSDCNWWKEDMNMQDHTWDQFFKDCEIHQFAAADSELSKALGCFKGSSNLL